MRVSIITVHVRTGDDIVPAFETLAAEHAEVVIVEQSNMLVLTRKQIAEAAAARKLPSVYGYRENIEGTKSVQENHIGGHDQLILPGAEVIGRCIIGMLVSQLGPE
jgi:hypothetical protein